MRAAPPVALCQQTSGQLQPCLRQGNWAAASIPFIARCRSPAASSELGIVLACFASTVQQPPWCCPIRCIRQHYVPEPGSTSTHISAALTCALGAEFHGSAALLSPVSCSHSKEWWRCTARAAASCSGARHRSGLQHIHFTVPNKTYHAYEQFSPRPAKVHVTCAQLLAWLSNHPHAGLRDLRLPVDSIRAYLNCRVRDLLSEESLEDLREMYEAEPAGRSPAAKATAGRQAASKAAQHSNSEFSQRSASAYSSIKSRSRPVAVSDRNESGPSAVSSGKRAAGKQQRVMDRGNGSIFKQVAQPAKVSGGRGNSRIRVRLQCSNDRVRRE